MKKVILMIILVLSVVGAVFSYFSYSVNPDEPPPYYSTSTIHHGLSTPLNKYYANGTRRTYIYEGIHPTGSQLLDSQGNLLEENFYQLSEIDGQSVLVVARTVYHTFWGQYHRAIALILLISALTALALLSLSVIKKPRLDKA